VALTDGDVAALAREAADLLDPELEIAIQPDDRADPYRWDRAHGWTVRVHVDGRPIAIRVESTWSPEQALAHLTDGLGVR
jgi:hypothetical protein